MGLNVSCRSFSLNCIHNAKTNIGQYTYANNCGQRFVSLEHSSSDLFSFFVIFRSSKNNSYK